MVEDCHEYFVNDILVHNCIAWLLCFWLITLGKNLSFYGIDSRVILSRVNLPEVLNSRQYYDIREQQTLRQQIQKLYDDLSQERDEFVVQKLEQNLRILNRKIVLQEGERFSVDELINSLRDERRTSRFKTKDNNFPTITGSSNYR